MAYPIVAFLSRLRVSVVTQQTIYQDPQVVDLAIRQGVLDDDAIIQMIADEPKYLRMRSSDDSTLLHRATYYKRYGLMKRLIEMGADIEATSGTIRITPLLGAVLDGDLRAVSILLEFGADPLQEDIDGENSYEFAERLGMAEILRILREHEN